MRVSTSRRLTLTVGVSLALLAGCGGSSDSGSGSDDKASQGASSASAVPVVASTNVYGDIVEQIGAGKVKVTSIIGDPAQDPHSYEANMRNQLELSEAKVVVENGGGYDGFIDRMLKSGPNSSAQVINAVKVSGKTPSGGEELNEHVWYDLSTVGKLASEIAAALAKASPADAATFTKNAKAFKAKLKPLETKEGQIKADHGGEAVAITEPVPLYLIEASGLQNKTPRDFNEAIEEGDDVSPKTLRETLALFTGKKVKALVYNEQTSGPQTEKVKQAAKTAGVPVVSMTETLPKGQDYLGWMTGNLDALADALATQGSRP